MSGGTFEYVMGQLTQKETPVGYFNPISSSGTWEYIPNLKYYDSYEYNTSRFTHGRGHLGDATRETLKVFGINEYDGWYSDRSAFPANPYIYFIRGGMADNRAAAGIFAFYLNTGSSHVYYSFRVILAIEQ